MILSVIIQEYPGIEELDFSKYLYCLQCLSIKLYKVLPKKKSISNINLDSSITSKQNKLGQGC